MKKIHSILLIVFLTFSQFSFSQYITPGNQLSLTLDQLVSLSGGVVSFSNGTYFINNTLTLSATDTLRIEQAAVVRVSTGIRLEISGTIISDPAEGQVIFTAADTTTTSTNFKGFRFEDSPSNVFTNTTVSYGGGIQLISSDVVFENCNFRKNGSSNVSAVITYSGCDPVISGCVFVENARSAIGSGANVSGSPKILNNFIYHNTTDNSNRPQINIGPGSTDTVYIVGNYVEGINNNVGGIGISNLLATGNTKAVVRNNYVANNRYGYAQIGSNISSVIENNDFIDNNIQNQPNLGGSGINFQASGSGNTALVRDNIIKGNLWGITIQGTAQPNIGTTDDPGGNVFYENGNTGVIYALYNNTTLPITAIGNYWGTNDPVEAENVIFHQPDQASLGLVTFLPLMPLEPVIESFVFLADENPDLTTNVIGTIDQQNHSISLIVPAGTNVSSLIPQITLPVAVVSDPQGGVATDFSAPVNYTITTPHGQTAVYTVTVEVEIATFSVLFDVKNSNGIAVTDAVLQFAGVDLPQGVYVINSVLAGDYPYEVSHPEYVTAFGSVVVTDANVNVSVVLNPKVYPVNFIVKDQLGNDIVDAIITLGGVTNGVGVYIFPDILPGLYPYSVVKDGYVSLSGEVEVIDEPVEVLVTMELSVFDVSFNVTDLSAVPIEGAEVNIQGLPIQTTGADGVTVFTEVLPGTYEYTVAKPLYEPTSGSFVVTNENLTIIVALELISGIGENLTDKISVFPNPANDFLYVQRNGNQNVDVTILDISGKEILVFKNVADDKLDISGLKAGYYMVILKQGNKMHQQKIQKL